jgi:2-desacetyl-2-hydroxyethyl bacteriochlorophyllide A dehydrogenase
MKAAVIEDKGRWAISDVPDPVPDRDEVLIRVRCCGVCGSDLHIFHEGVGIGAGHEFSGDIVEIGPGVDGWKAGDRVAVEPDISCGECFWCQRGEIGLCEQYYVELLQYKGAYSTYARAKKHQLHRLPDDMGYGEAAMVEPTTCAVHAVRLSGLEKGDTIAVLGMGPIGQLVARVARVSGAGKVYATEISPHRIELATIVADEVIDPGVADPVQRILELTGGRGPDIVFECAGNVPTSQQSVALARKGGTIVVAAICFPPVEIQFSDIVLRGLTVKGSQCFAHGDYATAFELIREHKIDVAPLLTCSMPLDDINEAFAKASRGEGGKILVEP